MSKPKMLIFCTNIITEHNSSVKMKKDYFMEDLRSPK